MQTATGHRSDIAAISGLARAVGAIVFVDGSQLVGALPVADDLPHVDVLAAPDHKFLLNAGRGMGYCYLSTAAQERFTPVNAGWRAGAVPFDSFFGPEMDLSPTASRFDSSISWLAAIGNEAALAVFDDFGPDAIYARNRELADALRAALTDVGWDAGRPARREPQHDRQRPARRPPNRRRCSRAVRRRESSARHATATCACRSTSTTTRTTSSDSQGP